MTETATIDTDAGHAEARPVWAEVDLGAITHNVALVRERAGRRVKLLVPVKANAYGHGAAAVGVHLASLGVDGLATANVDDAVAIRRAGATLPILLYGAALPSGNRYLLEHGITPTVHSIEALQAISGIARAAGRTVPVHLKVDAGMGRLGIRLDEAVAFAREIVHTPGVHLEGMYTHLPFSDELGETWSRRRLRAFTEVVRAVEAEHGLTIEYAQAAASSLLARGVADELNTVSPGHLTFGLHPIAGRRAEDDGYRKALTALRARLLHVGRRRHGDDLPSTGPDGLAADAVTGVVLFGMDNGYRSGPAGTDAHLLCHGRRCPVVGVSAEYTVIDLSSVPRPAVGDVVTIVGDDGVESLPVETVARHLGAPSAAYWLLGLKSVPYRYSPGG